MEEGRRLVVVKSIDGQRLEYSLGAGARVGQLRQELQRDCGIPLEQIRLLLRGRQLTDEQSIGELVTADEQVVHLAARLRPEERRPGLNEVIASVTQGIAAALGPQARPTLTIVPPPVLVQAAPGQNQLIEVRPDAFVCTLSSLQGGEASRHAFSTAGVHELSGLARQMAQVDAPHPRRPDQNSSAGIIGDFMRSLHAAMHDFLPQLARAQAMMSNEALLRTPEQRAQATLLVRAVARYFSTLTTTAAPLAAFEHFDFGAGPGQYGLRRAAPTRTRSPSPRPAPPPTAPDRDRQDQQREAEQRARDRREMSRLMGVLQEGVQLGTNMGQLMDSVSEEPGSETDVLSLVTRRLSLLEIMNVMNDPGPLDLHHAEIAADFRAVITQSENNREKLRFAFFDALMLPLRRAIRENRELLAADFDVHACLDRVNDEFVDQFKEVVLREYGPAARVPFSAAFALTVKLYAGRLAFELSLAAEMPEAVEVLCREALAVYTADLISGVEIDVLIDTLWAKVQEGLGINRSLHAARLAENALQRELREAHARNRALPPQPPLSAAYLLGRL